MFQPRLRASLTVLEKSSPLSLSLLSFNSSKYPSTSSRILPFLTFLRSAHHASEGRANGPKDRPGRRLGAKRSSEQYVIPGNIIFRQRGTKWFPGENCAMGRDHTIYATEKGYVKYYKDPQKHPKRSYIGVAFAREDSLPSPLNAPRKRRLGMIAVPLLEEEPASARSNYTPLAIGTGKNKEKITRRKVTVEPGYVYRETNYQIGKAMEKAAAKVRPYKRGERFLAWRKKTERIARSADFRAQKQAKKQKKTQAKQAGAKKMAK